MNLSSTSQDSRVEKRKRYCRETEEEAAQRIAEREQERHHQFWFEGPEVLDYLIENPTLKDLKMPCYFPKSIFLLRLLKPISSQSYDLGLVCKQRLRELDTRTKPLEPTDPLAAAILQDLRAALEHPLARPNIMKRLKAEDERESSLDVDAAENKHLEAASLRSLVVRCTGAVMDIPAKEEALYFLAAVATHNANAFLFSDTLVLDQVLKTAAASHASLDAHIVDQRATREEYDRLKIHAKFAKEKIYVPPTFSIKRYRHAGNWPGHKMRAISLYASSIMLHHWKRPELIDTLITNCHRHRLITRLMFLRLLHAVLKHWSAPNRVFSDVTHRLMKRLWETRLDPGEIRESQELIGTCFLRIRAVMGRTSAVITYPLHILQARGQRKSSITKSKSPSTNRKTSHISKKIAPQTLPTIS